MQNAKIPLYHTQTSIFYFKKVHFSSRSTSNMTFKVKKLLNFSRAVLGHLSIYKLKDGRWETRILTSKHIKANVCKNKCTCAFNILSFYLLYVNRNAKNGCFCCNTVCSTLGQKTAVCSTVSTYYLRKDKIGRYT